MLDTPLGVPGRRVGALRCSSHRCAENRGLLNCGPIARCDCPGIVWRRHASAHHVVEKAYKVGLFTHIRVMNSVRLMPQVAFAGLIQGD